VTLGRPSVIVKRLLRRGFSVVTRPLVIAQVFWSLTGGLTMVLAAFLLEPSEFTTFALLTLLSNIATGFGRASVFQAALIHQRLDPNSFVPARVAAVLCLLTAVCTGLLARPLGVSTWSGALLIGVGALFPVAYDWLRYRAMGMDRRWPVAFADALRMMLTSLVLILPFANPTAVSLQVYFTSACFLPFLLLAFLVRGPKTYSPYITYARAAAWQLGDFTVGQFIVSVPLLVLGAGSAGSTVSGIRLAQALLGPLTLVFAATVSNLVADAATQQQFQSRLALIEKGIVLARTIAFNAMAFVLLISGAVAALDISIGAVGNQSLVLGLLLVGGYMVLTGWSGVHAMVMRLLNHQAAVTIGRVVIASITLLGFFIGYAIGGSSESVVVGFATAGLVSAAVLGALSRSAYHRAELEGTLHEHSESGALTDASTQPEQETEAEYGPEPAKVIPDFIQYSTSNLPIYVLGAMLALAAGASVLTLIVTAADPTTGELTIAALLAAVALAAGWALTNWSPPVIVIRDGVLEVANRRETKIDLRDPQTRVELGDRPGSPGWKAVIGQPKGHDVVIRAQQVKARQFTEIVQHHRRNLRDPTEPSEDDG